MKVDSAIKGKRKPWIDIAKGILILFVLLGHVQYFAHAFVGIDDFKFVTEFHILFSTWYMPAFFIITGYCTNFGVPFREFAIKNFKSLIVPSILIGVFLSSWMNRFLSPNGLSYQNFLDHNYLHILQTCGPWFLTALFVAKMFTFVFQKYITWHKGWKILFSLVLMLASTALYNKHLLPNIWYFQHALLLQPFMLAGALLHNHQIKKREKVYSLVLGGGIF